MSIHETPTEYEIFHGSTCIARHAKQPRHAVVMEPSHYRGLLRAPGTPTAPRPPQWDPAYGTLGEVMVRDLGCYAALAETGGAS